jgi:hypothetical protein
MLTIHEVHEMHVCEHDWQPIQGWFARYRCGRCRVIGYKPGAVRPQNARCMEIMPYRCEARRDGQRCAEPAVHSWRGKKFRCAAHLRQGRTGKARETLAAEVSTASQEVSTAVQEVSSASHEVSTESREVSTEPREVSTASREVSTEGRELSTASRQVSCASREEETS